MHTCNFLILNSKSKVGRQKADWEKTATYDKQEK